MYFLKDRAGKVIANSFLVGFEEAANGDYNDYGFGLVSGPAEPAADPRSTPIARLSSDPRLRFLSASSPPIIH